MKREEKGGFVIPVILIVLSIFLYVDTYQFKFTTYPKASPQMWPRAILILLVLTSLILMGKLLFGKGEGIAGEEKEKPKTRWGMMLKGIAILFFYIFSMQYLGYVVSTFIFTLMAMLMLGNRSKFQLVAVPLLNTAFIFFLFTYAMFIPLPKGVWIFRTFSLLLQ